MLPLFTCLRAESSLEAHLGLTIEANLVLLELPLESEIRADVWPSLPDKSDGLPKSPALLFHEVGDDEGRGLHVRGVTLEIPAAQCTKMFLLANSFSINS